MKNEISCTLLDTLTITFHCHACDEKDKTIEQISKALQHLNELNYSGKNICRYDFMEEIKKIQKLLEP